jgi:hypothetical protein
VPGSLKDVLQRAQDAARAQARLREHSKTVAAEIAAQRAAGAASQPSQPPASPAPP